MYDCFFRKMHILTAFNIQFQKILEFSKVHSCTTCLRDTWVSSEDSWWEHQSHREGSASISGNGYSRFFTEALTKRVTWECRQKYVTWKGCLTSVLRFFYSPLSTIWPTLRPFSQYSLLSGGLMPKDSSPKHTGRTTRPEICHVLWSSRSVGKAGPSTSTFPELIRFISEICR